jgi:transcriptional regulator with XRE-family HTH domain
MALLMELRARLKAVRLALGESQREFGDRIGVGEVQYNRWETGVRNPSRAAKIMLERFLDDMGKEARRDRKTG